MKTNTSLADFIWKNADDLWGNFKHTEFGKWPPCAVRDMASAARTGRTGATIAAGELRSNLPRGATVRGCGIPEPGRSA